LLFWDSVVSFFGYVKKTDRSRRSTDHFQIWGGLFGSRISAPLVIFLVGVSVGRAEPFSVCQTNLYRAPAMSAWEDDSSGARHKSSAKLPATMQDQQRFTLWFKDRGNVWNPSKKSLLNDPSILDFSPGSSSGSGKITVPDAISDAALELQSVPMDDDAAAGSPSWGQSLEDLGLTESFSEKAVMPEISPPAAVADARNGGDSLDFSAPGSPRGTSKADLLSADAEGLRSDSSRVPGDPSSGADGILNLPSPGPIPQIASPEPSVTELCGLAALLFVGRRWLRSKSSSSAS
jgi:hypothetical protein